ncbi:zona pellucida-like domain-containing protein 1 [Halichoeres trimaculatus]|uniref:zona pellucida-like domain-containing protein 1 n=1 Tax=Halichoeres trimaculatus TaxID=147232 RepID=UPI003D9E898A
MRQAIVLCLLVLIVRNEALIPPLCVTSTTNRPPENSDIIVTCGTNHMSLAIYLCPIYQALYNESLMAINGQFDTPECLGDSDWDSVPPILKFSVLLNTSSVSACGIDMQITDEVGTGQFSDFSNVQRASVFGNITSKDTTLGLITYRPQILYKFSCVYPLQYLLNNTEVAVSGVNIAINSNNGSFEFALLMKLYLDEAHAVNFFSPPEGTKIKTKIYVAVTATNLTDRFHVLLDRCFATPEPNPNSDHFHDLIVGCPKDKYTVMRTNGESQNASFFFETFRFKMHDDLSVSTFYLHCVTRLCEVGTCDSLKPNCSQTEKRRKREAQDEPTTATVTSTVIRVSRDTNGEPQTFSASYGASPESGYSSPVVALIVCLVILSIFFFAMSAYFMYYIRGGKLIVP